MLGNPTWKLFYGSVSSHYGGLGKAADGHSCCVSLCYSCVCVCVCPSVTCCYTLQQNMNEGCVFVQHWDVFIFRAPAQFKTSRKVIPLFLLKKKILVPEGKISFILWLVFFIISRNVWIIPGRVQFGDCETISYSPVDPQVVMISAALITSRRSSTLPTILRCDSVVSDWWSSLLPWKFLPQPWKSRLQGKIQDVVWNEWITKCSSFALNIISSLILDLPFYQMHLALNQTFWGHDSSGSWSVWFKD